jgi:hypothetical protein
MSEPFYIAKDGSQKDDWIWEELLGDDDLDEGPYRHILGEEPRNLVGTDKSGNWGHEGRPGEVGGSAPGKGPLDDEPYGEHTPDGQRKLIAYLSEKTGQKFRAHGSVSRGETSKNDYDIILVPQTAEEEDAALEASHEAEALLHDKVARGEMTQEEMMQEYYGETPDPLHDALTAIGFQRENAIEFDMTPTGTAADAEVGVTRYENPETGHRIEIWESLLPAARPDEYISKQKRRK